MKREFLDLGKQPITNKFIGKQEIKNEFFYNLKVVLDEETKLVSIQEFVKPELMFNDEYAYTTSLSYPMVEHFKNTAEILKGRFNPTRTLEIGSNDGPFIKNFRKKSSLCVEPCGNFAQITEDMGYKTKVDFWSTELARTIEKEDGKVDLIYAANCICHIHDLDDAFTGVKNLLTDDGVFVFEDPSLLRMLERGSYDQIYDEHAHVFSVTALDNVLRNNGLKVFSVDNLSVHGGSNRIYATHIDRDVVDDTVKRNLDEEISFGINNFETYEIFAEKVKKSKDDLVKTLKDLKSEGKKIISIGATSKSSTVFNYCEIDNSLIDCITDTTPAKQGLLSPGSHIPVVDRESVNLIDYDYAYLGAWNFKDVIANKEREFVEKGGKFITHVPEVMVFS